MTIRFSPTELSLTGSGSALPGPPVSNDELLSALATHCSKSTAILAGRIADRLGIQSRHLSRSLETRLSGTVDGNTAPELCLRALEAAGPLDELSMLIGHTATPHTLLPPNISWVADEASFVGPYMELRQACTGFANALTIAAAMIAEDGSTRVGIVGSETGSVFFDFSPTFVNREQLVNCVQMGDGAGAVMLAARGEGDRCLISDIYCGHIGIDKQPGISIRGGGSRDPSCAVSGPFFQHDAKAVRRSGEQLIVAGVEAMKSRGQELADFDWIIPHQANGRMAQLFAERYPEVEGRIFVIADQLGNLGSAAIWIGLDRLRRFGQLKEGQRVLVLGAEASKYLVGGFVYTH